MPRYWTDGELHELIELWPTNSVAHIAKRLRRSTDATRERARRLIKDGVLDGTIAEQNMIVRMRSTTEPIKPDPQDFDEVKKAYCRKHHINVAQLCARFESDNKLAALLYELASGQARTRNRPVGGVTLG